MQAFENVTKQNETENSRRGKADKITKKRETHAPRTSNTKTVWCDANARPLSEMIVGGAMPRCTQTSCIADTTSLA
jgi:hypothetical protein